jgi:hypothetical protein
MDGRQAWARRAARRHGGPADSFTFVFPLAISLTLSLVATILLSLWLRGRR